MTQGQRLYEAGLRLIEAVERITRRNGLGQKLDLALAVNEFRKSLAASQTVRAPLNRTSAADGVLSGALQGIVNCEAAGVAISPEDVRTVEDYLTADPVPDGWALVPVEPTDRMIEMSRTCLKRLPESQRARLIFEDGRTTHSMKMKARWSAMLAASPKPTNRDAPRQKESGQ